MTRHPLIGRTARISGCLLLVASVAAGPVAADNRVDADLGDPRAISPRVDPSPPADPSRRPEERAANPTARRPFATPPGRADGRARDQAPGHVTKRAPAERPQPTGGVLPATPPVTREPAPRAPLAPAGRVASVPSRSRSGPAVAAVPRAPERVISTGNAPASLDAVAAGGGVVTGGVLGAVPAAAGAGEPGMFPPDVADPGATDAMASALLMFVLAAQLLVAAAWLPLARRMLGGFGTRRLR